jgi:type II secretory pathway pseudopilin PulG
VTAFRHKVRRRPNGVVGTVRAETSRLAGRMFRGARVPFRRRRDSGYALVIVVALLAIVAILAGILVPDLVRRHLRRTARAEEERLRVIGNGLLRSIEQTHVIPGITNWIGAVTNQTGLNRTEVAQVFPEFPADTNTSRIYLVHPYFTPGTGAARLPYAQTSGGIAAGSTNAPDDNTRVMIVSNARRELSLPLGSGTPAAAAFEAIWDWNYDPATKAPPSGWPSAWNQKGDGLHVQRLNLANEFHVLSLKGLLYSLNGSTPLDQVGSLVERQFLRGSLIEIYRLNGPRYASYVVNKNAAFEFSSGPLLYYQLEETGGVVATNLGSLGSAANGVYTNGPTLGQAGPRPPSFPGYPAGNNAVNFDGVDDYMNTSQLLPSTLPGFTLAGWIKPTANMAGNTGIFGARDVINLESKNSNFLRLNTESAFLDVSWPYPNNEWHHVAATGNGSSIQIYLDGAWVGSKSQVTSNYGNASSTNTFRAGGLSSKLNGNDYSKMVIDEVVFYDLALSDAEVLSLYQGSVPYYP